MKKYDPLKICKEEVINSLDSALKGLGYNEAELKLETPPEEKGDIALSCFALAKVAKKAPQEIAQEIAGTIVLKGNIEKCENDGPYVNFYINKQKLAEITLEAVLGLGDDYGESQPIGKKIILEHTSANPTDKLHIGRARNPIIGDTLARILKKAGFDVETQFYVDDMGKQAVTLSYGIKMWDTKPPDDDSLGPYQYGSKLSNTSSGAEAIKDMLQKLEKGDPETSEKVRKDTKMVMDKDITLSLSKINVEVDRYVHESQFVQDGSVEKVIDALKKSNYCENEEGAFYIDLEPLSGKKAKFFFTRSDGTSLYATRDIAYHLWKFEHCDEAINILGEDHKLESEQVKVGLKILDLDKSPEVIFYSFVSLPEGRMSTRKGRVVFLDDLIAEAVERAKNEVIKRREDLPEQDIQEIAKMVAIGAIRYNIVGVQPEKKIVFKWEEALNFEGNSAPFIQYAYARASSILKKAEELGLKEYDDYDPSLLDHPSEFNLIKEMARFPETIAECAKRRSPHLLAAYSFGFASMFNQFYRDCPVLGCDDDAIRIVRLALVAAAKTVLHNSLFCLGIEAPQKM
ncbi:MAG: arginine--tRNA ligase [Methanomassiliicoccales archaeon]|nr:MAG: arginine--tRNA ligase [Methanomassiliicoccales archaeon]